MALQIASDLVPAGSGTFYLLEDIYTKGGLQVQDSLETRDAIPVANLKKGALVLTLSDKKIWMVTKVSFPSREDPDAPEAVEWEELALSGGSSAPGSRKVAIHNIKTFLRDQQLEFEIKMGASSIVFRLETSRPTRIRAFSTPEKDETNPYEFISTTDHLIDDGRQLFEDGSVLRTRNYSMFANFQSPATDYMYFTIDNIEEDEGPMTVTITYMSLESASGVEPETTVSGDSLEEETPPTEPTPTPTPTL